MKFLVKLALTVLMPIFSLLVCLSGFWYITILLVKVVWSSGYRKKVISTLELLRSVFKVSADALAVMGDNTK